MIQFQKAESKFYENNKDYCETISEEILLIGGKANGYCNSYGFEINSNFELEGKQIQLEFKKSQKTNDGVIIPIDAIDEVFCNISISNSDLDDFEIKIPTISKLFGGRQTAVFKGDLSKDLETKFMDIFRNKKLDQIKSKNGTIEIRSRVPMYDLKELISLFL